MALETVKDAEQYLKEVSDHLQCLTVLAKNAGFYSHAGMWMIIRGAFEGGPSHLGLLVGAIKIFGEKIVEEYFKHIKGE